MRFLEFSSDKELSIPHLHNLSSLSDKMFV